MADSADKEPEKENSRKRKDKCSVSEMDTSGAVVTSPNEDKKRRKKKKCKTNKSVKENEATEAIDREERSTTQTQIDISKSKINKKLSNLVTKDEINKKLSNVMTKDDGFLIKSNQGDLSTDER